MPLTAAMLTFAFLTRPDLIPEQGLKIAVGVLCRKPSVFANAVHYLSRNRRRSIHLHFKPIPLGIYFALFAVSGFDGLIYESIWSHYLKLFLGHAAYAQTLVLALFMGAMAIGAWLAGKVLFRNLNLLYAYALVEMLIGIMGLFFHDIFQWIMNRS